MPLAPLRRVIISEMAYHQLEQCVLKADNQYEVGGLLLGHRRLWKYYIISVTSPLAIPDKSKVSFVLDGDKHTHYMHRIAQGFFSKPRLIGVWHSHICDASGFSKQDRDANRQITNIIGKALSSIVIFFPETQNVSIETFCIFQNGSEYNCVSKKAVNNRGIPKRYLKLKKGTYNNGQK